MTCLYFVVTGVQYWVPSYMLVAISDSRNLVNYSFIVCAGTGPTLGIFFGGWIIDYFGGYKDSTVTLKICLQFGMIYFNLFLIAKL